MERLTRTETSQKIIYTLGHTRWTFDKRDHSRLQDVLDWLFEYQALGTVEKLSALVKAQDEGLIRSMSCAGCRYDKTGSLTEYKAHCMRCIRNRYPDDQYDPAEAETALGGGGDG